MKHTPGPWEVKKESSQGDYSIKKNGYTLAFVYHSQIHDAEANAQLMAEAPLMRQRIVDLESVVDLLETRRKVLEEELEKEVVK